jgi:hypothetical protein
MNILNQLKLNQVGFEKADGRIYQVVIDDIPLLHMFRDYELKFDNKINGAYTDVLTEVEVRNALNKVGQKFTPLGCDCGIVECWFVTGQVISMDEYVCWGRWVNPYRDKRARKDEGLFWNYKEFPSIVFDTKQYETAIKMALEQQA